MDNELKKLSSAEKYAIYKTLTPSEKYALLKTLQEDEDIKKQEELCEILSLLEKHLSMHNGAAEVYRLSTIIWEDFYENIYLIPDVRGKLKIFILAD